MKWLLFFVFVFSQSVYAQSNAVSELKTMASDEVKTFDKELELLGSDFSIWKSWSYARLLSIRSLLEEWHFHPENLASKTNLRHAVEARALEFMKSFPKDEHSLYNSNSGTGKIQKAYASNITGAELPVNSNIWVLTFDDGPSAKSTPKLLEELRKRNVKANFFVLSRAALANKDIVQQEKSEGHLLANHSYSHKKLTSLDTTGLDREITESTQNLRAHFGANDFRYFRCPYGAGFNNEKIKKYFYKNKLVHVYWNVDTLDWQDKNPDTIVSRTLKQMASQKNRGVILFHDIHPQTLVAAMQVVDKSPSVKWVRLDDVFEISE